MLQVSNTATRLPLVAARSLSVLARHSLPNRQRLLARCLTTDSKTQIIVSPKKSSLIETLNGLSQNGHNVNFSRIVFFGNQSSGKTSLKDACTGIDNLFPIHSGMATARPMHISLIKIAQGDDYIKIGNMGEKIYSVEKARMRISEENAGGISSKPLEVSIHTANDGIIECSFVDLPGYVSTTTKTQDVALPQIIKKICDPYILDSSNIKVAVVSATEDMAMSQALKYLLRHGEMNNALCVITKIDMIAKGQVGVEQLRALLNDNGYLPKLGVVGVRLRSPLDYQNGVTIRQMLENEEKFIKEFGLEDERSKLGVPTLINKISKEQIKRISHEFPAIKDKMIRNLKEKKYGSHVMQRLIDTDDIHGISQELERIVTDLHPYSPMRIELEKKIKESIKSHVKSFVGERIDTTKVTMPQKTAATPNDNRSKVSLRNVRNLFDTVSLDAPSFNQNINALSDNFMLGECSQELALPTLGNAQIDSLAKGTTAAFVRILHPSEATTQHNRIKFMRDIGNLVSSMTSSQTFTKSLVGIINTEIKNFVTENKQPGDSSEKQITNDIGKLFFVNVCEEIAKRADADGLVQSINQMMLREQRPDADYTELSYNISQIIRPMMKKSTLQHPGFFETDLYPVDVEMYSDLMKSGYVNLMTERLAKDIFRMIGVNLLVPLITQTIETSMKTVKAKDFGSKQKEMEETIATLETQLKAVESLINNDADTIAGAETPKTETTKPTGTKTKLYQETKLALETTN